MKRVIKLGAGTFALRTPIVRIDQTEFLHPRVAAGPRLTFDYCLATVVTMADGRKLIARPWLWRILSLVLRLSFVTAPALLSDEPVPVYQPADILRQT